MDSSGVITPLAAWVCPLDQLSSIAKKLRGSCMEKHHSQTHFIPKHMTLHHRCLWIMADVLCGYWNSRDKRHVDGIYVWCSLHKKKNLDLYSPFLSYKETQRGLQTPFPSPLTPCEVGGAERAQKNCD
uniref:Uncharacterized protein n=1 Tax=Sphaerodactylus townsendi TaxID=933632 RepID=A0ACB8ECG0_9SAUR